MNSVTIIMREREREGEKTFIFLSFYITTSSEKIDYAPSREPGVLSQMEIFCNVVKTSPRPRDLVNFCPAIISIPALERAFRFGRSNESFINPPINKNSVLIRRTVAEVK